MAEHKPDISGFISHQPGQRAGVARLGILGRLYNYHLGQPRIADSIALLVYQVYLGAAGCCYVLHSVDKPFSEPVARFSCVICGFIPVSFFRGFSGRPGGAILRERAEIAYSGGDDVQSSPPSRWAILIVVMVLLTKKSLQKNLINDICPCKQPGETKKIAT